MKAELVVLRSPSWSWSVSSTTSISPRGNIMTVFSQPLATKPLADSELLRRRTRGRVRNKKLVETGHKRFLMQSLLKQHLSYIGPTHHVFQCTYFVPHIWYIQSGRQTVKLPKRQKKGISSIKLPNRWLPTDKYGTYANTMTVALCLQCGSLICPS